jgi:hypothetical protein
MRRPVQIAVIVVCFVMSVVVLRYSLAPDTPNGHIPEDFPNPWLGRADAGHPERIVIVPARQEPKAPLTQDGVELWPAWRCLDPACPGRKDGVAYVFPGDQTAMCPRCPKRSDPRTLERAYTPEAEELLKRIRGEP